MDSWEAKARKQLRAAKFWWWVAVIAWFGYVGSLIASWRGH